MIKQISFLSILAIFFINHVMAQNNPSYTAEWKKVEDFEKKGLTKSALAEVVKIFEAAVKTNNESQQVKAAMYQMKYRNMVEEDNREKNIFYVDTLISKTKAPARNILQSMQAEMFLAYKQQNRYRLYNRTALITENSKDITTWSLKKLNSTITALYKASLQNEAILKTTSLQPYDAILVKGNSRHLRPTLYDLLAHRALEHFMNTENDISSPSYKFILNDEKIFAPVKTFVNTNFKTADTASLFFNALQVLQNLLRFHLQDGKPDALLDADLKRLAFAWEHGVFTHKKALYENALLDMERNFSSHEASAQAMYLRASMYYNEGNSYNPFSNKDVQMDIKKAMALLQQAYQKFPKSEGGINSYNLLKQIEQPALNMQTEKVNVPGQAFKSLLKYKNATTIYLRVIKTTRETARKRNEDGYNKYWNNLKNEKALKSWSVQLPDLKDYQEHSVEIKTDGLPAGIYYLAASLKPDFSVSENILLNQVIYVSNISYITNHKDEIYVMERDNGQPLPNAEIQLWQQSYNYTTRAYEEIKKEKYNTDKNGFARIPRTKNESYNGFIQVKHKGDELFTQDAYYNYYYNSAVPKKQNKTFLFTDRSIYRPGQTVFFKGIMVGTNLADNKNDVLANFGSTIFLMDANGQKAGTLQVKTNAYGSYNGSFKLPEGQLNGQFFLQDSSTQSTQYFNVEEYKRPKFLTDIQKPSGTYRINDSITITGTAKAYAGNNIDGAQVAYRVVRKTRYPIWWGRIWPPYGRSESMEITNGRTITNANGEFTIRFKAIPDETADKKGQPVFYYEVSADVTDINGETRSGNTEVAVSYQALQVTIDSRGKLPVDSIKNIKISSSNINGIFEKARVNLVMHKLQSPSRVFRKRYWEVPDQFIMSKSEFYAAFPHDAYADEDQVSKWALGEKVLDITDTTSADGNFAITRKTLVPGWYKIVVTTQDKYGEAVTAEKYIQLTGKENESITDPYELAVSQNTSEPGQSVSYHFKTGFDKVSLITNLLRMNDNRSTSYESATLNNPLVRNISITEADRGGINLDIIFVKHNRVYHTQEYISIPWTNKALQVSYETFRDKTLPGSEEKWTIKISGPGGEKIAAEALLSMYDASLDQFKPHSWQALQSLWPTLVNSMQWVSASFAAINAEQYQNKKQDYKDVPHKTYDALLNNGWNEGYYGRDMIYQRNMARSAAPVAPEAMQDAAMNEVVVTGALAGKVAGVQVQKEEEQRFDSIKSPAPAAPNNSSIRKNFNETAFFFPALSTDANGNISFSFTIPEALTTWKMMSMAHTRELASGYSEKTVITQKPLMVQPNAPRFFREGDKMEFSAKIVNLTGKEITGTSQLELFDATTNKPVDGWFNNVFPNQYFTVAAGQSFAVKFPITIPFQFNSAILYRIVATSSQADGSQVSDGEEMALPVLTNRMLVTETFPLNMRNTTSKNFRFDKLLTSANSGSLNNHKLTVEYTSNPAWYAVQALPYLIEFPYECAEQEFNRYYANVLASYIANSTPKIKAVFEKWKNLDTAALLSNLQKNEELKSALLQETPWVLEAQKENQQKKNIALLFDMVKLAQQKTNTINKLKEMQSSNGGFTWFRGGPDDRYITTYILSGIGHLQKLNAADAGDLAMLKPIIDKALPYLDARLKEEYDNLIRHKVKLDQNNLSYTAIQYLYMRSFFAGNAIAPASKTAYQYYSTQAAKYWLSQSRYMQAMIALSLHRQQNKNVPKAILESLKQNSITSEEMGMYWKEFNTGGYYWYQAPIESHALMIEAFTDIDKNTNTIDDLKTWLLKQKQTRNWRTTKATSEACYALLLGGSNWLAEEKNVTIQLGNTIFNSADEKTEAGTGYFKKTIDGDKVQQGMGNISVKVSSPQPGSSSTSWGAVYWQYFEDLDKITSAATPLKLNKKLFVEKNSDRGPVLQALNDGDVLKVGDKIKVRIELKVDRNMEYIHMKDMRAACMEPVNVISQYKWQGGLGYYESTKDASTSFFFGQLPRGSYVFEYPMFVTHAGNFSNGVTTIQCMYAPEFSSHSEGIRVRVE